MSIAQKSRASNFHQSLVKKQETCYSIMFAKVLVFEVSIKCISFFTLDSWSGQDFCTQSQA